MNSANPARSVKPHRPARLIPLGDRSTSNNDGVARRGRGSGIESLIRTLMRSHFVFRRECHQQHGSSSVQPQRDVIGGYNDML
jgi:hypothetical protein